MFEASTSQDFRDQLEHKKKLLMKIKKQQKGFFNSNTIDQQESRRMEINPQVKNQYSAMDFIDDINPTAPAMTYHQSQASRYQTKADSLSTNQRYAQTGSNTQRPVTSYINTQSIMSKQDEQAYIPNDDGTFKQVNPLATISNHYGNYEETPQHLKDDMEENRIKSAHSSNISPVRQSSNVLIGREQQNSVSSKTYGDTNENPIGLFIPLGENKTLSDQKQNLSQNNQSNSSPKKNQQFLSQPQTHQINSYLFHDPSCNQIENINHQKYYPVSNNQSTNNMNILEQPSQRHTQIQASTPQEISSIQRKQMTIPNDESAYLLTSGFNNSINQDSANRFQFNTKALDAAELEDDDYQNVVIEVQNRSIGSNKRQSSKATFNGLSEPVVKTFSNYDENGNVQQTKSSLTLQQQVQNLMQNEPPLSGVSGTHNRGMGSFGNTHHFQQQNNTAQQSSQQFQQIQYDRSNSVNQFVNLEKMLQDGAYQVMAEPRSGMISLPQKQQSMNSFSAKHNERQQNFDLRQNSDNSKAQMSQKITHIQSSSSPNEINNENSSADFQQRKYKPKNLRTGQGRQNKYKEDHNNEDKFGEQKQYQSSKRRTNSAGDTILRKSRSHLTSCQYSQQSSNSNNEKSDRKNNQHEISQVSISQYSKDSYGKYFLRSRSLHKNQAYVREKSSNSNQQQKKTIDQTLNQRKLSLNKSNRSKKEERNGKKLTSISRNSSISRSKSNNERSKSGKFRPNTVMMNATNQTDSKHRKVQSNSRRRSTSRWNSKKGSISTAKDAINFKKQLSSLSRSRSAQRQQNMLSTLPQHKTITTSSRPPVYQAGAPNPFQTLPNREERSLNNKKVGATPITQQTNSIMTQRLVAAKRSTESLDRAKQQGKNKPLNTAQTQRGVSKGAKTHASSAKPSKREEASEGNLAHRLLIDLAKKYKNIEKNPNHLQATGLQRSSMLQELQTLAGALIKAEKRLTKVKADSKVKCRELKSIIDEQGDCITMLEQKRERLEVKLMKAQVNTEKLESQAAQGKEISQQQNTLLQTQVSDLRKRVESVTHAQETEKKEIIINMEREFQQQSSEQQQSFQMKINTLQSVNTQLNDRLTQFEELQADYENLRQEYNNQIRIIDEQTQTINDHQAQQENQHKRVSELELELEHQKGCQVQMRIESESKIREVEKKWEQEVNHINSSHQTKVLQMQRDHQDQLYGRKSDEDNMHHELGQLRGSLDIIQRQLNEKDEAYNQLKVQSVEDQNKIQELESKLQLTEEARQRIEDEAKDLEVRVQCMNTKITKLEQQKNGLMNKLTETSQPFANADLKAKDEQIKELTITLKQRDQKIRQLQEQLVEYQQAQRNQEQESSRVIAALTLKSESQAEEIQILAQGFQAQQLKINQQKKLLSSLGKGLNNENFQFTGGSSGSILSIPQHDLKLAKESARENDSESFALLSKELTARNVHGQLKTHRTSSEESPEQLINHQSLVQVCPSGRKSVENEQFSDTNYNRDIPPNGHGYQANEYQYVDSEKLSVNFNEGSQDTERELQNRKRALQTTHSFGAQQSLGQNYVQPILQTNESEAEKKLSQKEQELQILWNVLSHLSKGDSQTSGDLVSQALLQTTLARTGQSSTNERIQIGSSHTKGQSQAMLSSLRGNQSSIMNIHPVETHEDLASQEAMVMVGGGLAQIPGNQYGSFDGRVYKRMSYLNQQNIQSESNSDGLATEPNVYSKKPSQNNVESNDRFASAKQLSRLDKSNVTGQSQSNLGTDFESTPVVRTEEIINTISKGKSKELVDVKERIRKLMQSSEDKSQLSSKKGNGEQIEQKKESALSNFDSMSIQQYEHGMANQN